ncbi:hypothetical protein OP10G_3100 [Fimbriimonas ginsengisoli Gsoil 348]|uniref:Uncharacterized protein n=1 Tax=Fimbriimonas ginsengisoli Gsoil 348 TaxID=661478 RepID=A0A068NSF0_FIMGI|nr:hypothetical protein OP10G_3100 [Fimbriimonas ginsengisoli Gsoil 348]
MDDFTSSCRGRWLSHCHRLEKDPNLHVLMVIDVICRRSLSTRSPGIYPRRNLEPGINPRATGKANVNPICE